MPLTPVRVVSGDRCSLTAHYQNLQQRDGLLAAVCEEKSTVALSPGLAAIFCCIAGESDISTGTEIKLLRRGDIHICDAHSHCEMTVANRSASLLIAGSPHAWNINGRRSVSGRRPMSFPVPATYRRNANACATLLRLVRKCHADASSDGSIHRINELLGCVDALQSELAEFVARCPGSSIARKRAVFMRLHRAKTLIETGANDGLNISRLAVAANYSIGHFITLYRLVFGETPYAAISRHRLANAHSLLGESDLAIGDIAQSSGFCSPSAFTRAMRKHTGQSATQFRSAHRNAFESSL